MPLVKEDGTGVDGANTYADAADLAAFATARGMTIPAGTPEREVLLVKAMDFLETLDHRYQGYRSFEDQPLSWPRYPVYIDGVAYDNNVIPATLVKAQSVIAVAAQTIDLFPNAPGIARLKTHTTVGPITIEYSNESASKTLMPIISQANALLNILFGIEGSGILRVVRA